MKDEGGARYPSDYFFCLPVPAVFAHLNMIFDIYYSRSSPKSRGVGITKNDWEHDTLLITSSVYQYLQYDFFIFILQSPKLSVHVSTCYQWRLDYRIGAQLIRNGKTKVSSEPTWSRAAKSCVHGKFPSSLKRFHLYVYHTTLVTLVRD